MAIPTHIIGRALAWRLLIVGALLAAITEIGIRIAHVNSTTAGFAYLVVILFAAARWGLTESTIASIAAVLAFNFFFLPPVGTLTIADPQNWVALLAFLATSVTASELSRAAREQRNEAIDRQREMEQLYSFSRAILLLNAETPVSQQMAAHIARVFEAPVVALYDREVNRIYRAGPHELPCAEELLREAALRGTETRDERRELTVTAIRFGAEPIGSLAIGKVIISDSALQGLTNLAAIGIERARAQEKAGRAEAARQSDELKSTLLDAIAHDFKTPLTSIKAASTALLSASPMTKEQSHELLQVVDEEADRLSSLVTDVIQMARIEPGKIVLHKRLWLPHDIVRAAAAALERSMEGRRFEMDVSENLPWFEVDRELLQIALRQLLDNAVKYSPPGEPISVSAAAETGAIVLAVRDHGPGIPELERKKIFERFYRSDAAKRGVQGAGLGLAIVKDIVEAHGGEVWVEAAPQGGSLFCLSLPFAAGPLP